MSSVGIILSDHESTSEIIILKSINYLAKSKLKKIILIGSKDHYSKLDKQVSKIKKIDFINIKLKNNKYIKYLNDSTNLAIKFFKKNKINYLINMPLEKKKYLPKKYLGFTEFFSDKLKSLGKETMLLYNDFFSVSPVTTHIKIKNVSQKINKKVIKKTLKNIFFFYKKKIKKKPKLIVLGLNPHSSKDLERKNEDNSIIFPAIRELKKEKIIAEGPIPADSAFNKITKNSVFIGMYHDQVLIPFKTLNKFNGINITLGLKYLRLSPDHGTGKDIKKSLINNLSFINCIKFCENF